MALALLAAMAGGAFAATGVLWLMGVGGQSQQAVARLQGLRGARRDLASHQEEVDASLRRKAAVQLAGINLVSSNIATQWTMDLERAGLTVNAKEFFVMRSLLGLVFALVGMVLLPWPLAGLALAPVGYWLVGFWVRRRIVTRRQKLESQLIELLQMLSAGLRAGFGFVQALESSGTQMPDPIAAEVRRTLRDIAVGATVEAALEALNKRVGSSDFDIVITAILIQRNVGGNLSEILDNVAHTMRERERIRGEIRTLTSQQRMTGWVIGGIPPAMFLAMLLLSRDFAMLLITEPLGRMMMGGALVLEFLGFLVIRKIVNIEV
jgi:tight adherence protein B